MLRRQENKPGYLAKLQKFLKMRIKKWKLTKVTKKTKKLNSYHGLKNSK